MSKISRQFIRSHTQAHPLLRCHLISCGLPLCLQKSAVGVGTCFHFFSPCYPMSCFTFYCLYPLQVVLILGLLRTAFVSQTPTSSSLCLSPNIPLILFPSLSLWHAHTLSALWCSLNSAISGIPRVFLRKYLARMSTQHSKPSRNITCIKILGS